MMNRQETEKFVVKVLDLLESVIEAITPAYHAHAETSFYCGDLD